MGADIAQQVDLDEPPRALGDKDLPAVRGGGDARAPMDVDTYIVIVRDQGFARVQAHAHKDGGGARPRIPSESRLSLGRGCERFARVDEGDEEAVALRLHFDTAVTRDRIA